MQLAQCHSERKQQARGMCKPCYDKWLKSVNPEYKSRQAQNTQQWSDAHPEQIKVIRERRAQRLKRDPMLRRDCRLRKKYGISHLDYERMLATQDGGCSICDRKPKPGGYLHVDHSHKTGKVRGLLCHQCNWYLGTIDADPEVLRRLISYISKGEGDYVRSDAA